MIKYIASFRSIVFDPKNRIATHHNFKCSVIVYEENYSNDTRLEDVALTRAWLEAMEHFRYSRLVPLEVRADYIKEVKENA